MFMLLFLERQMCPGFGVVMDMTRLNLYKFYARTCC